MRERGGILLPNKSSTSTGKVLTGSGPSCRQQQRDKREKQHTQSGITSLSGAGDPINVSI